MPKFNPAIYRTFTGVLNDKASWEIVPEWKQVNGNYAATVKARTDDAGKKVLARFITGAENDWTLLGMPETVKAGTVISVAPLLIKLEERLRQRVVEITKKSLLNAKFITEYVRPKSAEESEEDAQKPSLYLIESSNCNDAASINNYFDANGNGYADCDFAVRLVFAKAVLDVVGTQAFNGLQLGINIPQLPTDKKTVGEMKSGDRGWIQNYTDYTAKVPGGAYQAENVIKVDNNQYWGFVGSNQILSEAGWKNELKKQFNDKVRREEQRNAEVPGFTGVFDFIDVARTAQKVFQYNISEIDPCEIPLLEASPANIQTTFTPRPLIPLPVLPKVSGRP